MRDLDNALTDLRREIEEYEANPSPAQMREIKLQLRRVEEIADEIGGADDYQ